MSDGLTIFDRLRMPFPTSAISWRVGSTSERDGKVYGLPLAYIDARDVMERLDDVVGPENWADRYPANHTTKTICALGIRIDGEWVFKEDGAGDTDFEADKGALSDAFKRAAVRWGIGRYLYDLKSEWVEMDQSKSGKPIIGKETRKALDAIHDKAITQIEWGDRSARYTYRLLLAALERLDTNLLDTFEADQQATIGNLPVAMRANLKEKIGHIGAARARKDAA